MHNSRKGFTLLEILVATCIFAIIAMIGVNAYIKTRLTANGKVAISGIRMILAARELYRMEHPTDSLFCMCFDQDFCDNDVEGCNRKFKINLRITDTWNTQGWGYWTTGGTQVSAFNEKCQYTIFSDDEDRVTSTDPVYCP